MWPGSVDDVKVFANSLINKKLRNGNLPITFQTIMKNQVKVPAYSIRGSLSSFFCLKQYGHCKNYSKAIFDNMKLSP